MSTREWTSCQRCNRGTTPKLCKPKKGTVSEEAANNAELVRGFFEIKDLKLKGKLVPKQDENMK